MNDMPDEVTFSEMTTSYGTYLMGMKPIGRAITKDKNGFYIIGIMSGQDGQAWIVFRGSQGTVYHKISPTEKNEKKFSILTF